MDLKHLHLHVRDRTVSEAFYRQWFGLAIARKGESLTFMTDDVGFDLALMDDASPEPMPTWFHFGFRLDSGQAVVSLHDQMEASGVRIARPLYRDETLVSYRCNDPDGYAIEIYWESPNGPLD